MLTSLIIFGLRVKMMMAEAPKNKAFLIWNIQTPCSIKISQTKHLSVQKLKQHSYLVSLISHIKHEQGATIKCT